MRRTLFILAVLALLLPIVSAEEIKHYLVVDEHSPSKDILLISDIADDLGLHDTYKVVSSSGITETKITNKTYETKIDTEISQSELHNRVTVFVYNQTALIIVGKNSPADHVILATEIENYLKNRSIPVTVKLSSDITHEDLKEELINGTAEVETDEISEETKEIDLSDYPYPFVKDGKLNSIIVVGAEAHTDNIIAATDIAASLTKVVTNGSVVGSAVLDTEVEDIKAQNAIIVGHACKGNRMTAEVLGLSYPVCGSASTIPENKAVIRLISHENGKVSLLVMGWTDQLTKVAAEVLTNYEKYDFKGTELYVCGTLDNPVVGIECETASVEDEEETVKEVETETEGNSKKSKETQEKETVKVIYVHPEENLSCNTGCVYENKCIPFGMRIDNSYCDIDQTLKPQKEKNSFCNNNFECKSNLCIDNQCVKSGIFRSIINWFKKLFM